MRKLNAVRTISSKELDSEIKVKILDTKVIKMNDKNFRISEMKSVQGTSEISYSVAQELPELAKE